MAYAEPAEKKPIPESLARKGEGTMDDAEFRAVVQDALAQSVQFVDEELSPDRAKATEYYNGKLFGNEEEGRSQVILTEVRDAVDGMVPSVQRVFFGAEHAVEFVPTRADNVAQAEQKTDYVRYVFEQECSGFLETLAVLKDGLIRKIGIFKWGWDDSVETKAVKQEGVTHAQLVALASDDEVEFTKIRPQAPSPEQPEPLFDVELTKTTKGGKAWVEAVPPEEFIYNRAARKAGNALLVAHRTEKTRGQLLAMGVKQADLDEYAGPGDTDVTLKSNAEELARRDAAGMGTGMGSGFSTDPELGTANGKVLYTEAFITIDYDGDGIAELRRICTIGPSYYPVSNDPADERPFAIFTPYPEPHALLGGSVSDRTMDMQKINSSLLRGLLDSLSASIFPRTVYKEGQASVADIMNTAIGAPIRERELNAVRVLEVPFSGQHALPVLEFTQQIIERRTGKSMGAAGLDADALQSTGKEAVGAVLNGSQEQIELICRVFAEMTLKPLFRGLGRLLQTHQPRGKVVKLRGTWVEVDPRSWDDGMDVTVNVALGATFTDKKIATLMSVAADQKELAQLTGGLMSPIVTLPMIRNTRAKILSLQGIKDADSYYVPLPMNWQPPQPAGPPPDPEAMWVQAEKEMNHAKTMKELAIKADELLLERQKAEWDHQFQMTKLAADIEMKKYAADATNKIALTQAELDRNLATQVHETELALAAHDQVVTHTLAADQQGHDQQMAERAADTADTAAEAPTA